MKSLLLLALLAFWTPCSRAATPQELAAEKQRLEQAAAAEEPYLAEVAQMFPQSTDASSPLALKARDIYAQWKASNDLRTYHPSGIRDCYIIAAQQLGITANKAEQKTTPNVDPEITWEHIPGLISEKQKALAELAEICKTPPENPDAESTRITLKYRTLWRQHSELELAYLKKSWEGYLERVKLHGEASKEETFIKSAIKSQEEGSERQKNLQAKLEAFTSGASSKMAESEKRFEAETADYDQKAAALEFELNGLLAQKTAREEFLLEKAQRIAAEQQLQAERQSRLTAQQQAAAEKQARIAAQQQAQSAEAEYQARLAAWQRQQIAQQQAYAAAYAEDTYTRRRTRDRETPLPSAPLDPSFNLLNTVDYHFSPGGAFLHGSNGQTLDVHRTPGGFRITQ